MSKVPVLSAECIGVLVNVIHFACETIQKQQKMLNFVEILSQPEQGAVSANHILERGPIFQKEWSILDELSKKLSTEVVDLNVVKSISSDTFSLLNRSFDKYVEEMVFAVISLDHNETTKGVVSASALGFKVMARIEEVRRHFSYFRHCYVY